METILKSLVKIAITIVLGLFNAMILAIMWAWFVVPFGIPPISYVHAFGLLVMASFLRGHKAKKEEEEAFSDLIVNLFSYSLSALVVAYIIHLFM